ncbi:hypothetical protein J3R30DRAFT_2739938 [Lentinula aciculospora]|uniref:Uncharacterized protein n=1 Tax=Lentinula aciculospora TaxID=153920 RepID=A0A9W9AD26_9AGAR|nr:hypothetical protein J3R30DRAFT_2739938 [Lentinula aciculospora]
MYPPTCSITENPDIAGIGIIVDVLTGKLFEYVPPAPPKSSLAENNSASASDIELADCEAAAQQGDSPSPAGFIESSTSSLSSWDSNNSDQRLFRGYLAYLSDHPHYFKSAKPLERSLFLVGSAIVVSAFLDAISVTSIIGLPPYHALIVLNLSLLNNLAGTTFSLFHLGSVFVKTETRDRDDDELMSEMIWWAVRFFDSFGLALLQTLVVVVFGTWFWVSTTFNHSFSGYTMTVDKLLSSPSFNSTLAISSGAASDPSQCVSETFYWAFTKIPVETSRFLHIFSLIAYIGSLSLPFLGPLVMVLPTVVLFRFLPLFLGLLFSAAIYLLYRLSISIPYPHPGQALFPTRLSPSAISTKLIFSAIMITNMSTSGTVVIDGPQWTYGQTLALFTAIIGVIMYFAEVVGHWREAWVERRKRMRENDDIFDVADAQSKNTDGDGLGSLEAMNIDVLFSWTDMQRSNFNIRRASSI